MWDLWLDLALGSACAGCDTPGRALCERCRSGLPGGSQPARPDPCPPGLLPVHAATEYADVVRALVVAHKEHRRLALAAPLGDLLAQAVLGLVRDTGGSARIALVPVPSRRRVVAARGHDPLMRITRRSAATLRAVGQPARVLPLLRQVRAPLDQAGLSARARRENLHGSLAVRGGRAEHTGLVLVDDVMTTGATLREAQRVLDGAGQSLVGAAVVAATRRRHPRRAPVLPVSPEGD